MISFSAPRRGKPRPAAPRRPPASRATSLAYLETRQSGVQSEWGAVDGGGII